MKKHFLQFFFILAILCLLLIVIVGIYRKHKLQTLFKPEISELNVTIVNDWLNALKSNNPKQALNLASKMVSKSYPYVPFPYYLDITSHCGINSRFFNPPFSILDYLYWKDAYELRQLLLIIKQNKQTVNIPEYFFNEIFHKIKLTQKNDREDRFSFMSQIWKNKKSDLLDKYLLFSEIMTQAGYRTQVIVLFSEKTKKPIHLISEIRKNDEVYTCDFKTGIFLNKSVSFLIENKAFLIGKWKPEWIKGLYNLLFKTEIQAMSYRKINQQLNKYLARSNNKEIPIIGLEPYEQMVSYKKQYYPNFKQKSEGPTFILGIEPFSIIKNSKFFPEKWILNNKNKK